MTWARIDDTFWCNPKVVRLPDYAYRLYVQGLSWAAGQKTNGFIPDALLGSLSPLRSRYRAANALVSALLWERVDGANAGFQIHDWGVYNLPSEEVEKRKKAHAERVAAWRSRKRKAPGDASQAESGDASRDAYATRTSRGRGPSHTPSPNGDGMGKTTPPAPQEGAASSSQRTTPKPPPVLSPAEVQQMYRKGFE